ncbi:hypothetical protein INT43_001555 [Umbelopsis isabellina]|uniref:Uncharacterized protein n=1 Tax=Mortierella isabellina TaxID=91625 RepID=A0A8H7PDU1_MORIS|nr:hypothetical protein INT43_001555 [Umbelopsis isabellina]
MSDAIQESLQVEKIPIELSQDMSDPHYTTEHANLSAIDRTVPHLDYTYPHTPASHPSEEEEADSRFSTDDNKHTPPPSNYNPYLINMPSPQSPSPWLKSNVTEEGAESRPYRSNEREDTYSTESNFSIKSQHEVQMKRNETLRLSIDHIKLTQKQKPQPTDSESRGQDSMVPNPRPDMMDIDQPTNATHSESIDSTEITHSESDRTLFVPSPNPSNASSARSVDSSADKSRRPSSQEPMSNTSQFYQLPSDNHSSSHARHVDRSSREDSIRASRLSSPDTDPDSLLDPSQGVTSLMDMMQLVQLTKTEKSTKMRQIILSKIIQTDDIALLQKFVHHEERIGIRALGNWLYSYYDKVMMRITLNILKALDKLPIYASDLKNLKIQGVVRLIATMSVGREDPIEVRMAVTNLDNKWERTHHYQPTKDEAENLETALAEARAAIENRNASGESDKSSSRASDKIENGKRPNKSADQSSVKRIKPSVTKEKGPPRAKAVTDTDFFNRLLGPKQPQAQEPTKTKPTTSEAKSSSTFNANELKKAKTVGRGAPQSKGSDFSLDALLSTIDRSPEQKRMSESPPRSPTSNKSKLGSIAGGESTTATATTTTTRKRVVSFAPDDRLTEYRYYTPNAEEWADVSVVHASYLSSSYSTLTTSIQQQPTGEAISHVHGDARGLDVGEGRMAFERTHGHQPNAPQTDWYPPNRIKLPDNLVMALHEETGESMAQAVREQTTFAAVYTSLAHIPPSPAEPNEIPAEYSDEHVTRIPLEDIYTYRGEQQPTEPSLPKDPASLNKLLAAAGSVLKDMNGVQQSAPASLPPPPVQNAPANPNGSAVDLNLVGGLLNNPSLVQSLLGMLGNKTGSLSPVPPQQPAAMSSPPPPPMSNTWQPRPATQSPPVVPQQNYGYYQSTGSPQQYNPPHQQQYGAPNANRNNPYNGNKGYSDNSYEYSAQPTPTAQGQYTASAGPIPNAPSNRPAINPNFRGAYRGGVSGSRGGPRGGRGKPLRGGGRGNKFRGVPNRY